MSRHAYLVVGGDSLVGGRLVETLSKRGERVYSSTRRKDKLSSAHSVYLDFLDESSFFVPHDVSCAIVVAAATNYTRCEKDPIAYTINAECIPRLVDTLTSKGIFTIFISTNSVFGGKQPWPAEDDPHAPGIPYAMQKHVAENMICKNAIETNSLSRLSIVRLTKILDCSTSPLPAWISAWKNEETVHPFTDLIFAPMSLRFVSESLATLAEKRISGNLHLSGKENISYFDLAQALANKLSIDRKLIVPTTATDEGVTIAFKPKYSGLGMQRTTRHSGLLPQPLVSVVDDLVASAPEWSM